MKDLRESDPRARGCPGRSSNPPALALNMDTRPMHTYSRGSPRCPGVRHAGNLLLRLLLPLQLLLLPEVAPAAPASSHASSHDAYRPAVASYLPEWRYEGANFETIAEHSTHLILFSLEVGPRGTLQALDRLPRPALLAEARRATRRHGTKLLICFGGNGRSQGFSAMVRDAGDRGRFVAALAAFLVTHDLDGVDYNWEYPGYQFGQGYLPEAEIKADYTGLGLLLKETRAMLDATLPNAPSMTLAYYPDGRQVRGVGWVVLVGVG